jgi:ribosomal protein S19
MFGGLACVRQLFNPVEIKPEMVGMYTGEFSMSYR